MAGAKLSGGIIQAAGAHTPGWVSNIGMSLSAGTFKLVGVDGNVFSSTNAGWVTMQSTTSGRLVSLKATSDDHSFIDDSGSSNIVGEEFGVTSGVAWGQDRPFYLYACNADNTDAALRFFISPAPNLFTSPATANIGYQGNPMATPSDAGAFFLTSTNVTVTHSQKPCLLIGGIRMRMSASDDWTVQTITGSSGDGIRPDPFITSVFAMPTGQMGAAANSFLYANGPTWATQANIVYNYTLALSGMCSFAFDTRAAGNCTNGTNATGAQIGLPYKRSNNLVGSNAAYYWAGVGTVGNSLINLLLVTSSVASTGAIYVGATAVAVSNNTLTNANDDLTMTGELKVF